jgi:superfamily II DNA or RNA helicase
LIIIEKIDEVYLYIKCPYEIALEIKDFFSCFAPNYKFHPRYKSRCWDGKLSFFEYKTQLLPIGLLKNLIEFFHTNNYKYTLNFDTNSLFDETIDKNKILTFCHKLFKNSELFPRDYQIDAVINSLYQKRGVLESPTGCHISGTKVLMFDGTLKNVEDVKINDELMGPDNKKRKVVKLYSGWEEMYKIIPKKGKSYIVNKNHVLHLHRYRNKKIEIDNITVEEFNKKTNWYKSTAKLKYNDAQISFNTNYKNVLSPYFVGYYLGDGHTRNIAITSHKDDYYNIYEELLENFKVIDSDNLKIVNRIKGNSITMMISKLKDIKNQTVKNKLMSEFKKIELNFCSNKDRTKCEDKFIPDCYKLSSVEDRMQLLAGLIDSDGNLSKSKSYYEVCSKSKILIEDIIFVSQSLGFKTSFREKYNKKYNKTYYVCNIMGKISKIPVRLERKKTNFVSKGKDPSRQGFDVEYFGIDKFYGFELTDDHLYFTDDFMINHNSGKSLILYIVTRSILENTLGKILLIVPSISLVEQMFSDFFDYGWKDCDKFVDILYSGKKLENKQMLISTYQSLANKDIDFFKDFSAILMDECHGMSVDSKSLKNIMLKCVNSKYKLGFTGTLPDETADLLTIFSYLGNVIFKLKTHDLIRLGFLAKIRIVNLIYKYPDKFIKENKNRSFPEEERIVLDDKFKISVIYGNVNPKERERLRKIMEMENDMILIGTYATMKQGINIKRIHNVVFASSYKSKITILQSIGRGIRTSSDKEELILWDIVDDLRWKKRTGKIKNNYLFEHFLQRIEYYKDQKFKYSNLEITEDNLVNV